ncbi:MAG: bifunctional methylenetetrahydrofolate dehydrogenase/methenyltetrahydrofolate cyclohydrolase FolD [Deltaproteobacteria bacterium]|nr:bifunctional methylenetetrahydrofolate dehydrogenase/methenyltetrahydrofolate cyclohydrolase FolD [Deltaproteobacteria bacterium]
MTNIIDGKAIAKEIREGLEKEVSTMTTTPGLAVVIVGDDPASAVYVRNKEKACENVGIISTKHALSAKTTEAELLSLIEKLNQDNKIHGILVQLPLPKQINEDKIIEAITPKKDVDGFHPFNVGRLVTGRPTFKSCTPYGIMELLKKTGIDIKGKDAVVVGRSNIVGKPMAIMLLAEHATVTICHSRTNDLESKVKGADIVIAAVGITEIIKGDWIKEGAVVIDVGMNRNAEGKLCGDVDFEGAKQRASFITPVPGGVGPMTIAMLLANTVESAKNSK